MRTCKVRAVGTGQLRAQPQRAPMGRTAFCELCGAGYTAELICLDTATGALLCPVHFRRRSLGVTARELRELTRSQLKDAEVEEPRAAEVTAATPVRTAAEGWRTPLAGASPASAASAAATPSDALAHAAFGYAFRYGAPAAHAAFGYAYAPPSPGAEPPPTDAGAPPYLAPPSPCASAVSPAAGRVGLVERAGVVAKAVAEVEAKPVAVEAAEATKATPPPTPPPAAPPPASARLDVPGSAAHPCCLCQCRSCATRTCCCTSCSTPRPPRCIAAPGRSAAPRRSAGTAPPWSPPACVPPQRSRRPPRQRGASRPLSPTRPPRAPTARPERPASAPLVDGEFWAFWGSRVCFFRCLHHCLSDCLHANAPACLAG